MPTREPPAGLFPALLKHWRGKRGLSQLDLALAADVSSKHVSFLETARSVPSAAMVVRLGAALDVPLRHVNAMLAAAGHPPTYPERDAGLSDEIATAIRMMKNHHDPFPLVVVDRLYNIVDLNGGARRLLATVHPALAAGGDGALDGLNLARLTFDPDGAHPAIVNFDELGRELLWRIQREVMADPDDGPLQGLLADLLALPTVGDDWRDADLSVPSSPSVILHLRVGAFDLRFLTTVTAFQAPQSVTLDELRIETWYPADDATAATCRALAGTAG